MSYELNIFLNKHRIQPEDRGKVKPTHLAFPNPGVHRAGSFHIERDDIQEFYKLIYECPHTVAINETHLPDYSILLVDLDFRKQATKEEYHQNPRLYKKHQIETFLEHLFQTIFKYCPEAIEEKSIKDETFAYVMEKDHSKYVDNTKTIKDGVHIVFPTLNLPYSVLYLIRLEMIHNPIIISLFQSMNLSNSLSDAYDEAAIERNGWMLYGCAKPGSKPYTTTKIYKMNHVYNFLQLVNLSFTKCFTRELCSLRKERSKTPLILKEEDYQVLLNDMLKKNNPRKENKSMLLHQGSEPVYHFARLLAQCLNKKRSDNYYTWTQTALCLSSIDQRLRREFIEFSKLSLKFKDADDCDRVWNFKPKMNYWCALKLLMEWSENDNKVD